MLLTALLARVRMWKTSVSVGPVARLQVSAQPGAGPVVLAVRAAAAPRQARTIRYSVVQGAREAREAPAQRLRPRHSTPPATAALPTR